MSNEVDESVLPSYVAIDFETANSKRDSACSIGLTRVEAGQVVASFSRLIRTPTPDFDYFCTRIHGLRWRDVEHEPAFDELWPELEPMFESVRFIAAHNAPFDRSVLRALCERYGLDMPAPGFLDTVRLARKSWELSSAKLSSVCAHLDIPLNHHDAGSDAEACARIILHAPIDIVKQMLPPPA